MKSGCRERTFWQFGQLFPWVIYSLERYNQCSPQVTTGKYAESHLLNACCPINRTDISLSMEVEDANDKYIMRKKNNLYLSLEVTTSILNQNLIHITRMLSNALSRSCQDLVYSLTNKDLCKGMIPLFPTSQCIIII